jgi:hypothetical protein
MDGRTAVSTQSDTAPTAVEAATGSAAEANRLLERLADRLGGVASATAVFGEPIVCEGVTVVPVGKVVVGFGGGAGRETAAATTGDGGGGGGGAAARPLGFIEIRNGTAVYRPISDPWAGVFGPLAALLAGAAATRVAGFLAGRRNRRCPGR